MIWILEISQKGKIKKYMSSDDYNKIVKYIRTKYSGVVKMDDYNYSGYDLNESDYGFRLQIFLGEKI